MTMHGRRLRRITALLTGGALVGGALLAAPLGAATPAAAADGTTITPNPAYAGEAFEGWGTSLVWFANATGDYPEELREELYQAVFGEDGLDLNIARYNIGGGNASDVQDYLRAGGAVEGWWAADPDGSAGTYDGTATTYAERNALLAKWDADDPASYDWSADATQRWWVERLAADDQITHWETFANSAPYFMTESGYVSGGFNASSEQLKPAAEAQFASYLVRVTEHLEDQYGIDVDTIDPFNEPNTNYWGTTLSNGTPVGGRQEGMHMGPARQVSLIDDVRAELDDPATTTDAGLSAMDETNPGIFATNWAGYPAATRAKVDRMNVHTYGTSGRLAVRDLAKQADTDLWMSEIEGNWVSGFNPVSIENGLGIAGRIQDDLRELEPNAWVLWQPVEDLYNMEPQGENLNWGSIFIDLDCKPYEEAGGTVWKSERRVEDAGGDSTAAPECGVQVNSKFNTIRNFTKYIHEGDHLMAVDDVSSTAAVRGDGTGATIVHRNTAASERVITLDLSNFGDIAEGATVTPVVTTQADSADAPTANALVEGTPVAIDRAARTATLTVPAKSVTTFVIDGVSGVAADAPALRDGHRYQFVGTQSGKALTAGTSGAATTIRDLATDAAAAAPQAWTVHEVAAGDRDGDAARGARGIRRPCSRRDRHRNRPAIGGDRRGGRRPGDPLDREHHRRSRLLPRERVHRPLARRRRPVDRERCDRGRLRVERRCEPVVGSARPRPARRADGRRAHAGRCRAGAARDRRAALRVGCGRARRRRMAAARRGRLGADRPRRGGRHRDRRVRAGDRA